MAARILGSVELNEALPHKDAAFFLDEAQIDGWSVNGTAQWTADHPHLRGHFPGMPIVPGVYLIEAAAQLAGLVIRYAGDGLDDGKIGVLAGVRKASFHRFVRPDERVLYTLNVKSVPGSHFFAATGVGHVADEKAITIEVTIAAVEVDAVKEAA